MKRSSKTTSKCGNATRVLASLIFAATIRVSLAAGDESQNLPAPNSSAQIECTTPDGRVLTVPTAADASKGAAALLSDDETLRCPLQEGRTTFVIKLPENSARDRFTVINENAAAAGQLKISVSNDPLPAASTEWVEVDGDITFSHKRLFNVSMVGVEARYMKLSFDVAKAVRLAAVDR